MGNFRTLGIVLIACLATHAAAAAAGTELQKYFAAAEKFEALKAEANKKNEMPRLRDKEVAETLAVLSNKSGTFGTPAFPMNAEAMDRDLCGAANKAQAAYSMNILGIDALYAEKKFPLKDDPETISRVMDELIKRNTIAYQDELFPLLAFGDDCLAATVPLLTEFMTKLPPEQFTPIRRQALVKFRDGVSSMALGALADLNAPGLSEPNRSLQLKAVLRDLPVLSGVLPLKARAQLKAAVEAALPSVPKAHQAEGAAMATILDDPKCEGLCKL